ncbi:hypothetical protein JHD50_08305 [Sulfurimonas sp. MAG313]|nr:hypothetical protein [Sulfurimonas sp. MAG313]MDF1881302.1 hypothetical protein [Sulfurimonas sp. MAG313]
MQEFDFNEIELISTEHTHNTSQKLSFFLKIKIKNIFTAYLIEASLFEESIDEVLAIVNTELQEQVTLELPDKLQSAHNKSPNKRKKLFALSTLILLISLTTYHIFVPPSINAFKDTSLKVSVQKEKGLCSLRAKVAFTSQNKKDISIHRYCGLLGFWKLEDTRVISSRFLKAEFSSITAREWILNSRNLLKSKNYEKAFTDIDNALYLEPSNETALFYSSELYKLIGESKKAIERDKKTLKKFPNYASIQQHLAFLYQKNGNNTKAYKHFKLANQLRPSLTTYLALAQMEEKQGLYQKALHNYKNALILIPNDSNLLSTIGRNYWKVKNFKKAGEFFKKSYLLDLKNATKFLNFYEASLVTKNLLIKEEENNFIQNFKNNTPLMMIYDMLSIIKLTLQNMQTQTQKEIWKQRYDGIQLSWSFHELISWLEESDLDEEHKYQVTSSIRFFIGYQQAYKIKHQVKRK